MEEVLLRLMDKLLRDMCALFQRREVDCREELRRKRLSKRIEHLALMISLSNAGRASMMSMGRHTAPIPSETRIKTVNVEGECLDGATLF